ncbi:MAG: AAA family ATPase [Pseudomonadota bacterium]
MTLFVVSGCSGGGKSTLIAELSALGYATLPEPGRRVVRSGIDPQQEPVRFAHACIAYADADLRGLKALTTTVFLDRSRIDAEEALKHLGERVPEVQLPYAREVFFAPPWPEIYVKDAERAHGFEDAVAEADRLWQGYLVRGYEVLVLPKLPLDARVQWLLDRVERVS